MGYFLKTASIREEEALFFASGQWNKLTNPGIGPDIADRDTNINCISWIAGNDPTNNNAPRMPHLVANVAAPTGASVFWKLNVTFHDRNGYPHRDFDTGDTNDTNAAAFISQDVVTIPGTGTNTLDSNATNGWVQITNGTPWVIYQDKDWTNAVAQGFFGGDATLSLMISNSSGTFFQQDYNFRIAGENPNPTNCKTYLTNVYGGPTASQAYSNNPHAWFAWAIAKDETQGEGGGHYYNHFLNNGGTYTNVYKALPGTEGRPNWQDDGLDSQGNEKNNSQGVPVGHTGSGGYGLFQLTYGPTETNYIMPRSWIWNWQSNVVGFGIELQGKITDGQKLYNALTTTYTNSGAIPNYGNFPALDAIVVTYYNGMYGGQMTTTNEVPVPGYSTNQVHSCWIPLENSWLFLQNYQSYATNVNAIINSQ